MKTTELFLLDGHQMVRLPDEFRFTDTTVSIRKEGELVILERVKPNSWPVGFFEAIQIDDIAFMRSPQGTTPTAPTFDPQ